jgi:hypothetical protein
MNQMFKLKGYTLNKINMLIIIIISMLTEFNIVLTVMLYQTPKIEI